MIEPTTMQRLRGILDEMFGQDRAAHATEHGKPWYAAIDGVKNIDRIDFRCFVKTEFRVNPHVYFIDDASLGEIRDYIDATSPSNNAH